MKRVFAVQLSDFYPSATLPQAIGTIWSYALLNEKVRSHYSLIKTFWENQTAEQVIQEIHTPDVLVCSCYVWNWERTYEIIKATKELYPRCVVIIGGPEPHYSTEWLLKHPEVDVLVPYYGEEVFLNILLENLNGQVFDNVPGTITRRHHNLEVVTPSFESIPSPYLNGFFDHLLNTKSADTKAIRCVFESNRGCPYSCTFCETGSKNYNRIYAFSLERCLLELEWIVKNRIDAVDVADANFGILPRDEELVDALLILAKNYEWTGRFLPTWSKANSDRVLRIAQKLIESGLDSIFGLSLQSFNQDVLRRIKRKNAFDLHQLSQIVEKMNGAGVSVYTEIIFPLPGDTLEGFLKGLDQMLDMPRVFDKFQINQLSRYTNTEMASSDYTATHGIEWARINGFTRHYHGFNSKDTVAIGNSTISREETFEGLFFGKYFLIPMYFYGIARTFVDDLHQLGIAKRKETIAKIYASLQGQAWFQDFKNAAAQHYFEALAQRRQFGYELVENSNLFFPEFAFAHQVYLRNHIHEYLKSIFPEFVDLIVFDSYALRSNMKSSHEVEFRNFRKGIWQFAENRELERLDYLDDVYIRGRFDNRWRKEVVRVMDHV